jgi:hypothetical protein
MPRRDGDVFLFGTAMKGLLAILRGAARGAPKSRLSMETALIVDEASHG